jgi:hypothetical protein
MNGASRVPEPVAIRGFMMHAEQETKCVKFNVDDLMRVSMALGYLGIDHHVDPGMQGVPAVMTAYYDTAEQAERLFIYLVHHASREDRIEWQQDDAHREIAGWCELCEVVNSGECDGGCLINHRLGKHLDFLFVRSAKRDASSELPWPAKRR